MRNIKKRVPQYYGMFYLRQNYDRVVGYLEREIDEDEFNKLI